MTLQQMRKEIGELKEKIELKESKDSTFPLLDQVCSFSKEKRR